MPGVTGIMSMGVHDQVTLTAPNAPSGAAALQPVAGANIVVSWSDNSSDETGFRIECSENSGVYFFVTNRGANSVNYSHSYPYTDGYSYRYRIRAYNGAGYSLWAYTNTEYWYDSGAPNSK